MLPVLLATAFRVLAPLLDDVPAEEEEDDGGDGVGPTNGRNGGCSNVIPGTPPPIAN